MSISHFRHLWPNTDLYSFSISFVKEESVTFDALNHLKRVRKMSGKYRHSAVEMIKSDLPNSSANGEHLSILLFPVASAPDDIPTLIANSPLAAFNPVPYILPVPAVVARTHAQYLVWTQVWPVAMVVIREGPKAVPITPGWERVKREWIGKEIGKVWREAEAAGQRGEVSFFASSPIKRV